MTLLCSELTLVNDHDDFTEVKPLPCNRWSCEYCQPNRKRCLIAQAMAGNPTTFITLTANPAFAGSALQRRHDIARAWRLIVKRAKREFHIKSLPYFAVVEKTKRGEPHLHILARAPYIPQQWLSNCMRELMNSPICDIRKIGDLRKAAFYISKYIGKEPAQFGTTKRYWQSRDYDKPRPDKPEDNPNHRDGWYVSREPVEQHVHNAKKKGNHVRPQADGSYRLFTSAQFERYIEAELARIERIVDNPEPLETG